MRAFSVAAIVALSLGSLAISPAKSILRGYSAVSSEREALTESQFIDIPTAQSALDDAATIGAHPHYAGTPADHALAVWMRDRMRAYGLAAELEQLSARVDTPRELVLELAPPADLAAPTGRSGSRGRHAQFPVALDLAESPEPTDPATAARGIGLPFNAGSADGDVSAPLVYADRGLDADYDTLAQAQVDVRGAVVLVRYGAQFRGLLAQRAQTHGAAGVIFYDDPKDDGAARGSVYPDGPWRPLTSIQRGWVGNGIAIPTLPISAANAQILLGALRGVPGPATWGGALAVAYPLARGPGRVHLIVKLNRKQTTLWNTIAVIPGIHGDQNIVLGAHRDAWVYGVGDNGDGITVMLEVARGLGYLLNGGWRPQRTIVIAGWDGEEIGLVGSRAYVARHHFELERGGVAYLNADENVTGSAFDADAVAAIAPVVREAGHAIRDPDAPATSLYDRWAAQTPLHPPVVGVPGGGSDHESFLTGTGTPIANMGFHGPFGVYHSSYDTLAYASLTSDPQFRLHRAAAQLFGLVALRLADADAVPYTFSGYIPLLRAGAARLAAADRSALTSAIDRLAALSRVFDRSVARADSDLWPRERVAARELDVLAYGVTGYASTTFADIDAAFATHDAGMLRAAVDRTIESVNRAADALGARHL